MSFLGQKKPKFSIKMPILGRLGGMVAFIQNFMQVEWILKAPRTLHPLNYFIFTLRGVYCKKIKFEPVEKIVVDLPSQNDDCLPPKMLSVSFPKIVVAVAADSQAVGEGDGSLAPWHWSCQTGKTAGSCSPGLASGSRAAVEYLPLKKYRIK